MIIYLYSPLKPTDHTVHCQTEEWDSWVSSGTCLSPCLPFSAIWMDYPLERWDDISLFYIDISFKNSSCLKIVLYSSAFCLRTMSIFIIQEWLLCNLTFPILYPFSRALSSFSTVFSYHLLWFLNKLYFVMSILMAVSSCPIFPVFSAGGFFFFNLVDCSSKRHEIKKTWCLPCTLPWSSIEEQFFISYN